MMINNEQYENLITLLKQALEFYSNENNYKENFNGKNIEPSLMIIDNGSQARFALKKIEELDVLNQDIENDYKNMSDGAISEADADFLKKVTEIQRMGEHNNGD